MKRLKMQGLLPILLIFSAAVGCSQSASNPASTRPNQAAESGKLKVVATFLPMYWFAKAVAGDKANIEILIPPGSEVHEYQATPANVQAIAQADVLVKNGLELEEFLEATVKNAQNPNLKEIDASQNIKALPEISPIVKPGEGDREEEHEHKEEEEEGETSHEHHHSDGNPHVWIDPILAKKQVETIRDGFIAADPKNQATYQTNAAAYLQQLDKLDNQFKQQLQKHPNCTFITFHDAYPYLAKRYELKQVAVVAIPEDNLSPADIQRTVETVKQFKVKALLGEPGVDNKLLESLSQDLKLTLSPLNSLESGPLEPQHYFAAMQVNLQTLVSACQ